MTSQAQLMRQLQHQWEQPPEPSAEELRDEWICDRASELWVSPHDAREIFEEEGLRFSQVETIRILAERRRLFQQAHRDDTSADECLRDIFYAMDVWFIAAATRDLEIAQEFGGDDDEC